MVSSRAETCLDLPSLSRSGVSVVSALVNRGFPCLCLSLCFFISLSGVVCRLCRLLCSVVPHATEQRCVVSHATEQRCVACYRAALCRMLQSSVCYRANVWRCFCGVAFWSFVVFVGIICPACVCTPILCSQVLPR